MPFKVAVLVPDGAADLPLDALGGLTPLEAADTPAMDEVARRGCVGTARTVPAGMQPGSDVANLSLLGYDPVKNYSGRGPIEAANLGVEVPDGWTVFRCNIVTVEDGRMLDYSAGHISQEESARAVRLLQESLGGEDARFVNGKSYRNLLLRRGDFSAVSCTPPHDITDMPFAGYLPAGAGSEPLLKLIDASLEVLSPLEVSGRAMIWPWGQGLPVRLAYFQ